MKPNIIEKELSYQISGLLFKIHNDLGRFCREKQYGDAFEKLLKDTRIEFEREKPLQIAAIDNKLTNKADFIIRKRILLDFKAKPVITKEDYYQINRYLESSKLKLGIIVNFRNTYLRPIRVIRSNS